MKVLMSTARTARYNPEKKPVMQVSFLTEKLVKKVKPECNMGGQDDTALQEVCRG